VRSEPILNVSADADLEAHPKYIIHPSFQSLSHLGACSPLGVAPTGRDALLRRNFLR
jgi:hypothetical protein